MAKILVVDDEAQVRGMLAKMLSVEHHEVIEAENGVQGCKKYREHQPDLLITDLVMPEKNGIDMIMELKKEFPSIRVVAISGGGGITGSFDYLPVAKLVGALHILQKPFTLQALKSAVVEALRAPGLH
ncbi:MAG TPA: response regulator [Gammaproteobacteria bacterium]|nr:response regulator [Gammaproteobacteria bacterium]